MAHYRVCTDEASKIFSGIQDSERLSKAQRTAVNNWLDLVSEMKDQMRAAPSELTNHDEGEGQEKIRELEARLKQVLKQYAFDD